MHDHGLRDKLIFITEASNNKKATTQRREHEYTRFWQELKKRPTVQGVTYFVASAASSDFPNEVWVKDGHSVGIAEVVKNR